MNDDPQIPVMNHARYRAWPKNEKGGAVRYMPLSRVMTMRHPCDAHYAAYSEPNISRRLSDQARQRLADGIHIVVAVYDADCAAVHGTSECAPATWRTEQRSLISDLRHTHPGIFGHDSRGGYRLLGRRPNPIVIKTAEDVAAYKRRYAAECNHLERRFGIKVDRLVDWQRLFRAPYVVRDGNRESPMIYGDPFHIGLWEPELFDSDYPPLKKKSVAASRSGPRATGLELVHGILYELFNRRGWIDRELSPNVFVVRCPWEDRHSCGTTFDTSTILYAADGRYGELGWLHCLHGSCLAARRDVHDVLALFPKREVYQLEGKCAERTKNGKTCAGPATFSDGKCRYHSATDGARLARPALRHHRPLHENPPPKDIHG